MRSFLEAIGRENLILPSQSRLFFGVNVEGTEIGYDGEKAYKFLYGLSIFLRIFTAFGGKLKLGYYYLRYFLNGM
jgi:hypothetical protein